MDRILGASNFGQQGDIAFTGHRDVVNALVNGYSRSLRRRGTAVLSRVHYP
jgi:hypothetical protein